MTGADATAGLGGTPIVLGLGGNLGDPVAILRDAVAQLDAAQGVRINALSPLYVSAPVGGVEQPEFRNAVVVGTTDLSAAALLDLVALIEQSHGRVRDVRWGPRTLDIDIVAFGDLRSDDPRLTLPHPRAHERAFVLVPWLDVDPDAVLPGFGRVADLVAAADAAGLRLESDARWIAAPTRPS